MLGCNAVLHFVKIFIVYCVRRCEKLFQNGWLAWIQLVDGDDKLGRRVGLFSSKSVYIIVHTSRLSNDLFSHQPFRLT